MNESVEQRNQKPPGLLPRNVQNYVILGVSVVIILILWLTSGDKGSRKPLALSTQSASDFARMSEGKIAEYKKQLETQERLLREQQALLLGKGNDNTTPTEKSWLAGSEANGTSARSQPDLTETVEKQLHAEQIKKEYQSRFGNNVALSYREGQKPPTELETLKELLKSVNVDGLHPPNSPKGPNKASDAGIEKNEFPGLERVEARPYENTPPAHSGLELTSHDKVQQEEVRKEQPRGEQRSTSEFNRAEGRLYRVPEGAILESVLLNRLNSDFTGPVICMVTNPVYSHDRQRLLIPEGGKLIGEAEKVTHLGQERVSVAFHRLIMPDGYTVSLDQFKGLNQIGETALKDQVNHHYFRIFGLSIVLGGIAGFANRGVSYGPGYSAVDAYRTGAAESLAQSSNRILDRYLNILPTATIREGHRVKVFLSADLWLPDYRHHQMPSDLSVGKAVLQPEEREE